eukprot:CAMPEP_0115665890 /NCGR_PEP_ID=MMETSP0272-20121206/49122_1 /TAXON_ID=71861 /ORGANISM="Scrippsiella trochoidea, Strain CCMP3099" /LENGTH=88 /DNA_ID=CAMNT_0003104349 /DNA_START=233 /DNA_END=499 /DNA_ORIENTATION=-
MTLLEEYVQTGVAAFESCVPPTAVTQGEPEGNSGFACEQALGSVRTLVPLAPSSPAAMSTLMPLKANFMNSWFTRCLNHSGIGAASSP